MTGRRRLRVAAGALRCQPDARLVRLVREGHVDAFEEIVCRYRAPLVAYAAGIVSDHDAEDVVQEALTRAHSALSGSRGEMRLRPWLFTIVRNGALNALRDEPLHAPLDESHDGVPQPPEVAAQREELAALTARVRGLPHPQREALVKRELEGRSHAEIAALLGLSPGAVRGLIYRARAALRDGAGMLIPLPVLRALLNSTSATPEATGAAGAAAAGLAGGGGVALKAGATLGVAVIAVGSGIAVQSRDGGSTRDPATTTRPSQAVRAHGTDGSGRLKLADAAAGPGSDQRGGNEGEGRSSGPGGGHGPSDSSGPGPGGHSGGGRPSGPESGTEGTGGRHAGSNSSGDDGIGGIGGGGDGGGGSSTSRHGGSGSSGSGSDDGTSGTSGDAGGSSSGSGSSGDGGGGDTTTTADGGSSGDGGGGTTADGGVDGGPY
jgi:RNA polymerase sigma factor (sigma-70 family)